VVEINSANELPLRVCDSRGIDKWERGSQFAWLWGDDDLQKLHWEIKKHNLRPIVVLYCASTNNRPNRDVVIETLKSFQQQCSL